MSRRHQPRNDPSRPWISFGVSPPQPPNCAGCDAPNAPFGIGPPLRKVAARYCATCHELQPETQRRIAERAREALDVTD